MPRTYHQYCSLARTLDIVGERWTLLIIRDLLGGPKRYKDLLHSLHGIGTNLLAKRLKELESADLVEQTRLSSPVSAQAYGLTERGRALRPAVVALAEWGLCLLENPRNEDHWLPQWNPVALRARFNREAAYDVHETYAFDIDGYLHYVVIDNGDLDVFEGQAPDPAFTLTFTREVFLAVIEGHRTFEDAMADDDLMFEGDFEAFLRCSRIFNKPEKSNATTDGHG